MTEEQLDSLRFKLGGDWYDTWWITIDERFDPMPLGFGEPTFFHLINKGWLEMYGAKQKGNVWVISNRANTLKNDATLSELKLLVEKLEEVLPRGNAL